MSFVLVAVFVFVIIFVLLPKLLVLVLLPTNGDVNVFDDVPNVLVVPPEIEFEDPKPDVFISALAAELTLVIVFELVDAENGS